MISSPLFRSARRHPLQRGAAASRVHEPRRRTLTDILVALLTAEHRGPWGSAARYDALSAELNVLFANTPAMRIDAAIESALQRVGRALNLDRAAIVDCSNADGSLALMHRWSLRGTTWPPAVDTSGLSDRLRRGETMRRIGDTSFAVMPLHIDDRLHAGLWLSVHRRQRWPHLDSLAATFSLALRLRGALADRHTSVSVLSHVARVATIGGLAASLAHELNQPLTAIRSNAQTAQRYLGAPSVRRDEMRSLLLDIVADVTRAGEIIDRMRTLLRNGPPSMSTIDLNDIVRGVTKLLASDAVIRRVQVVLALQPALPLIRADSVQIQQVILNLLMNALEAIGGAEVSERRVLVTTQVTDPVNVLLTVRDTGPGLGPAPERWFEPFRSTKEGGLGVGLPITRMIVEAHGGSVKAANNNMGGANFQVRLPTNDGIHP